MRIHVLGDLDALFAWDGRELVAPDRLRPPASPPTALRGAAACVLEAADGTVRRLVRDPLGINKLFWAPRTDGGIDVACRPHHLISEGHELAHIRSVPRGAVVDVTAAGESSSVSMVPDAWHSRAAARSEDLGVVASRVARLLDAYLAAIAAAHPDRRAYVCLSGGLDSTGIALVARRYLPDIVGVSFDLERKNGRASEDRITARRVARDLGLPLLEVTVSPEALLEQLDVVLLEGIDWRAFNVHAGLVNAALAQAIAAEESSPSYPLVFTGDMANEFLVDYHAEEHGGQVHYALPRLPVGTLRAMLVRGLESSNREIGVFGAWGLAVVQPYAVAVDDFLSLPVDLLSLPDAKQRLARAMHGAELPYYVYDRPKTRAQVGGEGSDGGVLGVCVDRGIDEDHLRARFAALHDADDESEVARFIRTGMFRAAVP